MFLHNHPNFKDLIELTAQAKGIQDPVLVEKDYWIMQCLYSLSSIGLKLELKGGTSLSKGFEVIHRFSEDIDIKIDPDPALLDFDVKSGRNQDKAIHRESRKKYFDWIAKYLNEKIDGVVEVSRDEAFDDNPSYRNGGIRLIYRPVFELPDGLKEGILLEVGFDRTTPNILRDISSWAYDYGAKSLGSTIKDNRAFQIPCYEPKYTFVEKLQAVVKKYRQYKEGKKVDKLPENFLRHYYDLSCLLDLPEVKAFIGTQEYEEYKKERFKSDNPKVSNCEGFYLNNETERQIFNKEYLKSRALYYQGQIPLDEILKKIGSVLDTL